MEKQTIPNTSSLQALPKNLPVNLPVKNLEEFEIFEGFLKESGNSITLDKFYVIKFLEDNSISTVHAKWIVMDRHKTFCRWPRMYNKQLVLKKTDPSKEWTKYDIKILSQFDSYSEAFQEEKRQVKVDTTDSEQEKPIENIDKRRRLELTSNFIEHKSDLEVSSANDNVLRNEDITLIDENTPVVLLEEAQPIQTSKCEDLNRYLSDIIANQNDIKVSLSIIMDRLNRLDISNNRRQTVNEPSLLPSLPCAELTNLKDLEKLLNQNEVREQLETKLSCVGGFNKRNCANRCLSVIFNNNLAQQRSWTGQKGNFKIRDLILIKCVLVGVRSNFPNVSDREFEEATMDWFRHSKQRSLRDSKKISVN
ncbi:hypothetical protein FQR65_LT19290 [Abscondita terminalis]|nr:hypothetical protein FQR65_LT19290 [Abscondita terminalis]